MIYGVDQDRFILRLKRHVFFDLFHDLTSSLQPVRNKKCSHDHQQEDQWKQREERVISERRCALFSVDSAISLKCFTDSLSKRFSRPSAQKGCP